MTGIVRKGLFSRNGFVRKGARALLEVPKWWAAHRASDVDLAARPPVLANSFPKSGTHLLVQLIDALPDRVNYGAFLGTHISSFQFRERTADSTRRFIRAFAPGEVIRGHLVFEDLYAEELAKRHAVNYFIYRDPRDVVVSDAHYLREMNRWHRLAPYFRKLGSIEEAIALAITGLQPPVDGLDFPDIGQRFQRYLGWLRRSDCLCIKFEDLRSERRDEMARQVAEFYAAHVGGGLDIDDCVRKMIANVAPQKSHTFRSGKKAGWKREFTPEHCRLMDEVAGEVLIELGYELDHGWVTAPAAAGSAE